MHRRYTPMRRPFTLYTADKHDAYETYTSTYRANDTSPSKID